MTYNEQSLLYRFNTIVSSGYEAVSLLPFLSEKHTSILFPIKMYTSDSVKKRKLLTYNRIIYHFHKLLHVV